MTKTIIHLNWVDSEWVPRIESFNLINLTCTRESHHWGNWGAGHTPNQSNETLKGGTQVLAFFNVSKVIPTSN